MSLTFTFYYKDNCQISDEGFMHFSKQNWKRMTELTLCSNFYISVDNAIGERACMHISAKAQWPNLEELNLRKLKVT